MMLEDGKDRDAIASALGVSPGQVSAIAAHRKMGTYATARGEKHVAESKQRAASSRDLAATVSQSEPGAVALGEDIRNGKTVLWEPNAAANPHVLILGESGFGKTYSATRLIVELARIGLPSIVFDYGQGFSVHQDLQLRGAVRIVEIELSRHGIGLNPLTIYPVDLHGPSTVAQRVADTFVRVYPKLGVQQHAVIRRAVLEVFSDAGIVASERRTWTLPIPPFRDLEQKLAALGTDSDPGTRRAAASAGPHVSTLFFFDTFRKTGHSLSWVDLLTENHQIWILQLGGLEPSVERAVTEFLLWGLIRYFEVLGPGPLRCFVVLDEAHKLAFGPGSPVEKILREGRKFGLGVILASQQPEDFSSVAFGNTATKLVFQVGDQSGRIARLLQRKVKNGHSFEYIANTISTLERGCAYVVTSNIGCVTRMFSFGEPT